MSAKKFMLFCGGNSENEPNAKGRVQTNTRLTSTETCSQTSALRFWELTQHSIPDKSIADCVEALIGAYLIACGRYVSQNGLPWQPLKRVGRDLMERHCACGGVRQRGPRWGRALTVRQKGASHYASFCRQRGSGQQACARGATSRAEWDCHWRRSKEGQNSERFCVLIFGQNSERFCVMIFDPFKWKFHAHKQVQVRKTGGHYCCVVNCHNNVYADGPWGIKFYRFPNPKRYPDCRKQWIKKVNRNKLNMFYKGWLIRVDMPIWQNLKGCSLCLSKKSRVGGPCKSRGDKTKLSQAKASTWLGSV